MIQLAAAAIRALQLPGGDAFTTFVDDLIRTHAKRHHTPDAAIETNIRTNIGDQGADTVVRAAVPADPTGRFDVQTVWQYKATAYVNVGSSERLVEGAYVRARIPDGFGFRLAIADTITPAQRDARVAELNRICRDINRAAPGAFIASTDDLVAWANAYPGYVLRWGAPRGEGEFILLDSWGRSVSHSTPTFVHVPGWEAAAIELRHHVSFAEDPATVLFAIQGEAGVGKSRLVYEVLRDIPGMDGLVLYSNDEDSAVHVARRLANATAPSPVSAVLVADECGVAGRESIRQVLQGHRNRVRVIAIDNSGQRPVAGDPEFWLKKMPEQSLEQILGANYGHIPPERRRAYADVARGYPRLAADLCSHDLLIAAAGGDVRPAIASVRDYLELRLTAEQREALAALSLLTKVGYRGDASAEIASLCQILGLERDQTVRALQQIRSGPGFVVVAGRYFYVTPEIVCRAAFADAWLRWLSDDPDAVLAQIPEHLLQAFLTRVQRTASEEVRRVCGDYFRGWAAGIRAVDLVDVSTATRFADLVETEPSRYLPRLRRIIDDSPPEVLRQISGRASNGRWGSRRVLVWLTERLARLPEHFDDSGHILVRLAVAETEPDIGNNATGIWIQLFRILLSGTAVPFPTRLALLRGRLRSETPEIRGLATRALEAIFSDSGMRMEGSPVVAGRIPPAEWHPKTRKALLEAERQALGLAGEAVQWGDPIVSSALRELLVRQTRWFGLHGLLLEAEKILRPLPLSEAEKLRLIESLDEIFVYDASRYSADLLLRIKRWRESLAGGDLHARLVALVSQRRWSALRLKDESAWLSSIKDLATEFITSGTDEDLLWLFQPTAHAAGEFGFEVGLKDAIGVWLSAVLQKVLEHEDRAFARGYVHGTLSTSNPPVEQLNSWLDDHERDSPTVVADLALSGGEQLSAFQRVLRLADRRAIPATFLFDRSFSRGTTPITEDRFEALIERLAALAAEGDTSALQTGLDALGLRLHDGSVETLLRRDRVQVRLGT